MAAVGHIKYLFLKERRSRLYRPHTSQLPGGRLVGAGPSSLEEGSQSLRRTKGLFHCKRSPIYFEYQNRRAFGDGLRYFHL
ncbi:hypothetical protein TNCV_1797971 [Trichonephila clavipes]|nr:hypothetical protein TNCV_1797971 [Trichonephila clavipes]